MHSRQGGAPTPPVDKVSRGMHSNQLILMVFSAPFLKNLIG
jgi:hypothetical protein